MLVVLLVDAVLVCVSCAVAVVDAVLVCVSCAVAVVDAVLVCGLVVLLLWLMQC